MNTTSAVNLLQQQIDNINYVTVRWPVSVQLCSRLLHL